MSADYLSAKLATLDALITSLPPDDALGRMSLTELREKVLREMARIPAGARPVSEHIAEEMEARGWTGANLVERLNGNVYLVASVLLDAPLTPLASADLGRAFGVEPGYFLNLDRAYRESRINDMPECG